MSARARRLSVLLAVLLAVATPLAVAAASGPGASTYRVKSGDTITSIAVQLRLSGGWQQLYQANKDRIGADPNRLQVGTDLTVPTGAAVPTGEGYVVQPGDTLNSIAARLHVPGGGNALFAANRNVIGPDPNRLEVGQTLLPPGATNPQATTSQPKTSAPPAALNHPAAPAPVAAGPNTAESSTHGAHSGQGTAILWSVLAGLLFVAFVVLVLFALPRWRRTSSQEVWVGGSYSADNQPAEPAKPRPMEALAARFSRPEPPAEPPARRSEAPAMAMAGLAPVSRQDEPSPVRLVEPQRFQEPQAVQLTEPEPFHEPQPVRLIDDRPARQPESALPLQAEPQAAPVPPADVRTVVAGLQPGSVGRQSQPRRPRARSLLSYAVGGLRTDSQPSTANERGLTDELLGEVRLVDPSTPLTKDRR